jgi:hypothetical protein
VVWHGEPEPAAERKRALTPFDGELHPGPVELGCEEPVVERRVVGDQDPTVEDPE